MRKGQYDRGWFEGVFFLENWTLTKAYCPIIRILKNLELLFVFILKKIVHEIQTKYITLYIIQKILINLSLPLIIRVRIKDQV